MATLWIDASAGVAGDMLLGALVDAGADLGAVQAAVDAVVPGSVRLTAEQVVRGGQRATKVHVDALVEQHHHRHWTELRGMLERAELAGRTRELALACFGRLAEAEGRVHGIDPEEVHFHEVGALDSIADVVGCCEGVRLLGIDSIVATPVAVGAGTVRVAHGVMPVPVPAVAQLALGWPTVSAPGDLPGREPGELATPTGMALVRALADAAGPQPALVTRAVGVGAGTKDFPDWPNVVRVVLGEPGGAAASGTPERVTELACNIDDMDPRLLPGVLAALLDAGALDAWLTPIVMKKGRPAHTLHVLCVADLADPLTDRIFATTTTLGVRRYADLHRSVQQREIHTLEVAGQPVRVKVSTWHDEVRNVTPEFDDVAGAARVLGVPEKQVLDRAREAAMRELGGDGPLSGR